MKSGSTYNLDVFHTADMLNKAAAAFIIDIAKDALANRGKFIISLSGGDTPKKLYHLLSKSPFLEQLPWKKTFVFWGDERCVPLDDEQNNAHQAKTILLDKSNIPVSHIFPVPVNLPPAEAAIRYENEINFFFGKEPPRFDLMLLGLGENGHTASLFPGTKVIDEQAARVSEVYVEEEGIFRITMTAPLINESRNILFLVTGAKKADILDKVLNTPYQPDIYPAQLIHPHDGFLLWFADGAAASLVKNTL
jgi:6-phosphogluconolactonase